MAKKKRKYLAISCVGENSLHKNWSDYKNRNYNSLLINYNFDKINFKKDCDFYIEKKGFKFNLIWEVLSNDLDIIDNYDYIWLTDDDILVDGEDLNKMFDWMHSNNSILSQISLTKDSYWSWRILINIDEKRRRKEYRNLTTVEIMMPCMRIDFFKKQFHFWEDRYSGYGLDSFIWPTILDNNYEIKDKDVVVLDFIQAKHTRPVGNPDFYNKLPRHPHDELHIARLYYKDNKTKPKIKEIGRIIEIRNRKRK